MKLWTRLLQWYDKHGRDLPWRKTRDPYRILVSEIMLQQTQVSRGLLFYERWLKQFPDFQTLAKASNADVIRAWAGLGYNRRALMLRDIAIQMFISPLLREGTTKQSHRTVRLLHFTRNDRQDKQDQWRELKGIGPYTAAAIAAFAFRKRTIPIDTNIRRVLGRLLFTLPYPQPTIDDKIRRNIDRVLPRHGRFYDVPQALFDLATMHCTKVPDCLNCPMRTVCPASTKFLSGHIRVPKQMIKKNVETRHRNKKFPDRIYRGRILKLVQSHFSGVRNSVLTSSIGPLIDETYNKKQDHVWVLAMISRLEKDGLISHHRKTIQLPE